MRFESVTAHSFGPFRDEMLRFAPNMNVIHGPNESGKSSWHAVLYAAFCGMRRGGGLRKEDKSFTVQHKPWAHDVWEVSTVLSLNDGRRIELHHDLAGKVDCCATDAVFGRDVSDEIINDGSPDGSVWLGLDRRSFLATACVRQTDLLSILDDPDLLQEHLQRAAATSGVDATAAAAISALERFRKEHVGLNRANSTKPLAKALQRVAAARDALERASSMHGEFLELSTRAEELRSERQEADKKLRLAEAAVAARRAKEWQVLLNEAEELLARHPDGPPVSSIEDDKLAQDVATAIRAWQGLPELAKLEGPNSSELREQIETLPDMPKGDLKPHPDVSGARNAYLDVGRALDRHREERPPQPVWPDTGGLSEEDLRNLARDLDTSEPARDSSLERRLALARERVEGSSTGKKSTPVLVAGVLVAVVGAAALGLGLTIPGLMMLVVGGVAVVMALVRGSDKSRVKALEELRNVENLFGEQRHAAEEAARRLGTAQEKCSAHGLQPDPAVLRSLAEAVSKADRVHKDLKRWTERQETLLVEHGSATALLVRALAERGVEVEADIRHSLDRYIKACAERELTAGRASRRQGLLDQLAVREAAEKIAEDTESARASAETALKKAAAKCGVVGEGVELLVRGLKEWQEARAASLDEQQTAREEWARLESLLNGRTVEEMHAETVRQHEIAARLAEDAGEDPAAIVLETEDEVQLARLRQSLEQVSAETARLKGQIDEQARRLPSVSEAEEELAAAERQLDEIRRLDKTLERTLGFLQRAEEKVHRDIAPLLAETVRSWLAKVTANRYEDARVDPESLAVRVRSSSGSWREAARLSHGTAEQIYLLLRVAIAEHLTKLGETCPLILDDVTAQSDEGRTTAILDMLHQISETRQVILFSQEREVLEWARDNLRGSQDSLVTLNSEAIGA